MRWLLGILFILFPLCTAAAVPGLHLDWLDKNIDPAKNFFEFANGGWQKNHPIPAAYAAWDNFRMLHEHNQQLIKTILEESAKTSSNPVDSIEQKVGDFYFSGMDEANINQVGVTPLAAEFARINNISNTQELQQVIAHLQAIGVDAVFIFGQMQDFKDSTKVIGMALQGGLGLPDRDYYLQKDKKFQRIRQVYLQHVANMFELLGDEHTKALSEARTVMQMETMLAKASLARTAMRDPHAIYHPMNLKQLAQLTPNFSWAQFFANINHPDIKQINLATPKFFQLVNTQLQTVPLDHWKIYLRWHFLQSFAPFLSAPFVQENFHMISTLTGTKELLPRWKRVLNAEDFALGFAIGQLYVKKNFPESSKHATQEIIHNIRAALRNDLQRLPWMTPATRKAAIKKLDMMEERVGYPDKWRDYSALKIDRGPYVLNMLRANEFFFHREMNKIGKPVDKNEWEMTPQTVNAYYDPSMNRLNIPAGILQPPFFNPEAPAAVNYGAIGFVIGHEMTHGFDDQGAQFDGQGNLKNWWSKEDLHKFRIMTQAIAKQYSTYTVNGNMHVQGKLVLGEATADLGGLTLAYRAFQVSQAYKQAHPIDGFTPEQQFFLGAAHVWAMNIRPQEANRLVITDPHPPALYRVNGTMANMQQFQLAFGINDNSPMVNKEKSMIW